MKRLDIAFCLDATGGMVRYAEYVRDTVAALFEAARSEDFPVRVKIVAFRDYLYDSDPISVSEFLESSEQADAFLSATEFRGGGDMQENALESLFIALGEEWDAQSEARRAVVLLTDADPLALGARRGQIGYPDEIPENVDALFALWRDKMRRSAKLVLFAPLGGEWDNISNAAERQGVRCTLRHFEEFFEISARDLLGEILGDL